MANDLDYFELPLSEIESDIKSFLPKLDSVAGLADRLFSHYDWIASSPTVFEQEKNNWAEHIHAAEQTIKQWQSSSGRTQNYTPEQLAEAQLRKEIAKKYSREFRTKLMLLDELHRAIIRIHLHHIGLADMFIAEGKEGKKFALVELSARLSPALTFEGSSNYLSAVFIPYGKEARTALGEVHDPSIPLVSAPAVCVSAHNAHKQFGAHYVLAETSAAPRADVPKSGRKPEIYTCRSFLKEDGSPEHFVTHHVIDTPFREKFDSVVREIMYEELKKLFQFASGSQQKVYSERII